MNDINFWKTHRRGFYDKTIEDGLKVKEMSNHSGTTLLIKMFLKNK